VFGYRKFASDVSGAMSIEMVVLVASLMGIGTLSAVTVQSGALVRAGVIGQGLDDAQDLAQAPAMPSIMPDSGPIGTALPGNETPVGGDSGTGDVIIVTSGGTGGGGLPGGGDADPDCPAAFAEPDAGTLECDEQAAEDL
jgi:hypothetical protein